MPYDYKAIESKWQSKWEADKQLYHAVDFDKKRQKKYILVEFPYPSGEGLHIGHAFTTTGADVYARWNRMRGYNVLFPMGWDAFGLPTENYAIKNKLQPAEATKKNTDRFRQQMKRLAFSFDWIREINTTDPAYYKWTQWIFIQLFKKGLAYKKEMPINWCPSCKIGLANEEVVDGKCERCGAPTGKKDLSQWLLKITQYADRLADELDLTEFPLRVTSSQRNWIGRSVGAKIKFKIKGSDRQLEVFTTRPDTLWGATFMVVAPEHPLVKDLLGNPAIKTYVAFSAAKSELERTELDKEKTGVATDLVAINPVNNKEIPIWVSDFVLASYGTGAIMSVPAHDQRDFDFAKRYGLDIIPVIQPESNTNQNSWDSANPVCYEGSSGVLINSGDWNGLIVPKQMDRIIQWLEQKGVGEKAVSYHLRDWIFSRQHYWGEPIPMVHCDSCGWVPVPEDQLPVELPQVEHYQPTDTGESPLAAMIDWVNTVCPACGGPARRETDTMPNWAGSSWYYLRYLDPKNNKSIGDTKKLEYWQPVDVYVGGDEHTTLHLLYSRFWHKFLNDLGAAPGKEPYIKRVVHGVILGPDGSRMSKSKGNVIIPDDVVAKYGVDAVRVYLMFIGPFDGVMAWNERALKGVVRFLEKVRTWVVESKTKEEAGVSSEFHRLVKKVTDDIAEFKFNTVVSSLMEICRKVPANKEELQIFVRLLAPLAPYLAEELWGKLGGEYSVHTQPWPEYDESKLMEEVVEIPVQVNGKVRAVLKVPNEQINNRQGILELARAEKAVSIYLVNKSKVKEIYIPGKIVNFSTK